MKWAQENSHPWWLIAATVLVIAVAVTLHTPVLVTVLMGLAAGYFSQWLPDHLR